MSEPAPPAYFLSPSVENVRCFGQTQTLDLSNGAGHPARWTLILGENGVGKTTLLQMLALMQLTEFLDAITLRKGNIPLLFAFDRDMVAFRKSLFPSGDNHGSFVVSCSVFCDIEGDTKKVFNVLLETPCKSLRPNNSANCF